MDFKLGLHGMTLSHDIRRYASAALGRTEADLVVKEARTFDLVTGQTISGDIAICGDRIVAVGGEYRGRHIVDAKHRVVVPGFIDTHLHVESSLVTPGEFDRCVLPRGVTTAICDPHEIANVLGKAGIEYFLDWSDNTALDLRVQLSSCVPATSLETSGATLLASDLIPMAAHRQVIGLAEFMNFPGVVHGDPVCLDKLVAFQGRHIDGHAPLLRGAELDAYLAAGIRTDHETTSREEALEKLSKGMTILIREGSVSKDLEALMPLVTPDLAPFLAFCTDDRNPLDIAEEGHLDFMIRTVLAAGARPLDVYRVASISAARAFGLRDRGLVAPGWRADLVILDDMQQCRVGQVVVAGRLVEDALFAARRLVAPVGRHSVNAPIVTAQDFAVLGPGPTTPVIGVVPGRIITEHLSAVLPYRAGLREVDLDQDIIKVAVVERHRRTGRIGRGFVKGFGLKRGAIASSVGHDSHNICVVGADGGDMAVAVNHLSSIEGGFCVVEGGRVIADLPLPVAGLMSLMTFEEVRDALRPLRDAAWSLGVTLAEPFLQVAFLPLPVIPHLKITDLGLVDVDRFQLIAD
jgi:adenine deaminase